MVIGTKLDQGHIMNARKLNTRKSESRKQARPDSRVARGFLACAALLAFLPAAASAAPPQEKVDLGSAARYVVLAGSLISNIPGSAITGDIGLSPAAGSFITGFGENEVTGTVFTTDATGPAGSVPAASDLTAAKGDITVAYNDMAGRMPVPVGDFLNPGSGNIGGSTLESGLYKFTGGASITGSDVTLSGGSDEIWIFQIASDLVVGNGIKVILAGGARAENIFWQVGTSATLGTTVVFKGTIVADQSISMNTGASLEGRALARIAAVTLASNAITRPASLPTSLKDSRRDGAAAMGNAKGGGKGGSGGKGYIRFRAPSEGGAAKLMDSRGRQVGSIPLAE
jgi:ice-binding like protein